MICVPYGAILNKDIKRVKNFITDLEKSKYHGKLRNNIGIKLFGYKKEDSKYEFENYEVRQWVQKLFEECPYIFYYLTEVVDIARNMFLCLASVNGYVHSWGRATEITFIKSETQPIVNRIIEETLKYELKINNRNTYELQEMLERTLAPFIIDNLSGKGNTVNSPCTRTL